MWRVPGTKLGVVLVAAAVIVAGAGLAGATNGPSAPAARTLAATPAVAAQPSALGDAEAMVATSPVRVLDTRGPSSGPVGVASAGPLAAGQELDLPLTTSAPNRPLAPLPSNAVSAVLNITVDQDAEAKSFLTVWPTGEPRPLTSANNAEPGLVSPNLTIARLGSGGSVSFYNQQGAVNLAVDLVGYTIRLADALADTPAPSKMSLGQSSTPVDLDSTFRPVATFTAPEDGRYVLDGSASFTKTALLAASVNPTIACKWTTNGGDAGPTFRQSLVASASAAGVGVLDLGSSAEANALGEATLTAGQTADFVCNATATSPPPLGAVQANAVAFTATKAA